MDINVMAKTPVVGILKYERKFMEDEGEEKLLSKIHLKHNTLNYKHSSEILLPGSRDVTNSGSTECSVKSPIHNVKSVSFKEDCISGYMDPPNPWSNGPACSTEELVYAYKLACDNNGIKPMPKLLRQLQVITNFSERNEMLTLKGERMDYKHCDAFEEVLRRVQFQIFDLEAAHLEEETAIALFDMIEYYETCTKLYLSFNKNIGIRGWQSCARMLKRTPCIVQLDARNTSLTEQVMPMLGRALRLGSQLAILHLENAILSGRPLMILVTAIKMNETLRELYLADNKLMPSDGIQLGNMLKFNHKVALLDLRNNHLQDVGTSHLCDGLFEQVQIYGLNTLVLWNNQISYQSMPSLARSLVSTKSLETLNLGHNNITNEGIHRLKDGLLLNKSLIRIGLQAAKISCEGAVALAEFIADSPRLLRIDLRENDVRTGGLMALSLSLKVSKTVTRMDLDKDPKRESGMKDYADQQKRLLQDISNLMLRNRDLQMHNEEVQINKTKSQKIVKEIEFHNAEHIENIEKEKETNIFKEPLKQRKHENVQVEVCASQELIVLNEEIDDTEDAIHNKKTGASCDIIAKNNKIEFSQSDYVEKKGDVSFQTESGGADHCSLGEAAKKGEHLHLKLPLSDRITTLESPAYIPESALPMVDAPTEEEIVSQTAAQTAVLCIDDIPIELPPSPMSGTRGLSSDFLSPQNLFLTNKCRISSNTSSKCTTCKGNNPASHMARYKRDDECGCENAFQENSSSMNTVPDNEEHMDSINLLFSVQNHKQKEEYKTENMHESNIECKTVSNNLCGDEEQKLSLIGFNESIRDTEIFSTGMNKYSFDVRNARREKSPDFHTSLTLNKMKLELANVIESLEKKLPENTCHNVGHKNISDEQKLTEEFSDNNV